MAERFLTPEELVQLTGWRAPRKQVAWLRSVGMRHHVNGAGRPVVTWAAVEGQKAPPPEREHVLNFAAIR